MSYLIEENFEEEEVLTEENDLETEEVTNDNETQSNGLFDDLEKELQAMNNQNDLDELSELELDLAKLENLQLDLSQDMTSDNAQTLDIEPLKEDNSNLYGDSAENMELNQGVQNYNTVKQDSPQVKIAPPKNRELSKIYSAKLEKDYNVVTDNRNKDKSENKDTKKSGGLFSKIFKKK